MSSDTSHSQEQELSDRISSFCEIIKRSNINVQVKSEILRFIRESQDLQSAKELYQSELRKQLDRTSGQPQGELASDNSDSDSDTTVDISDSDELFSSIEQKSQEILDSSVDEPIESHIETAISEVAESTSAVTESINSVAESTHTPIVSVQTPVTSTNTSASTFLRSILFSSSPLTPTSTVVPSTSTPLHLTVPVPQPRFVTPPNVLVQSGIEQSFLDEFGSLFEATEHVSTMATNLTPADITQITNIVTQNTQNDAKIRNFSGLQKEAVSWMDDFEYVAIASNWDDAKKVSKLGAYLTGSGREWYSLYVQGQNLTWDQTKDAFFRQFLPVDYHSHLREEFRTRKQKLYEPSANFIVSMRAILNKSNQQMTEAEAVEFIISNMQPDIKKELRLIKPATYALLLEKANVIEFALKSSQEADSQELVILTNQLASMCAISSQSDQRGRRGRGGFQNFNNRSKRGKPRCYSCNKIGHVWVNCRSNWNNRSRGRGRGRGFRGRGRGRGRGYNNWNLNNNWNYNNNSQSYQTNALRPALPEPAQNLNVLNVIRAVGTSNGFFVEVLINDVKAIALVDTGSAATFINDTFARSAQLPTNSWSGSCYHLANNQKVKPLAEANVKLSLTIKGQTKSAELNIFVLKDLTHQVVLGANVIRALGIIIDGKDNTVSY